MDCNSSDAHFFAAANDPQCNFTPIGNQNFGKTHLAASIFALSDQDDDRITLSSAYRREKRALDFALGKGL